MPSKETVYGKKYYGRLKYTYTMPNGVNPIMSEFTAVLRNYKFAGSEKCYPDFPYAIGSLMHDLKVNTETHTNDVVATDSVFVSCNVTSDVV